MLKPFHLSFVVDDKEKAKQFYCDILGCEIGRDNPGWFDIRFFGHQITIHQATDTMPAYTIDHFGPLIEKAQWQDLVENLNQANAEFLLNPKVINEGEDDESGKFVVKDFNGNLLEFKYYLNFERTVMNN